VGRSGPFNLPRSIVSNVEKRLPEKRQPAAARLAILAKKAEKC
jgi:hypothetical protein